MSRLVIVGGGKATEAVLKQVQKFKPKFPITVLAEKPLRNWRCYQDLSIELRFGVRVNGINRYAQVVELEDGSRYSFHRLVLATGQEGWRPSGIHIRSGVVVNRSLQSSDGHIFAIGDCAEIREKSWSMPLRAQARTLVQRLMEEEESEDMFYERGDCFPGLATVPSVSAAA